MSKKTLLQYKTGAADEQEPAVQHSIKITSVVLEMTT
jgi:hypothetical protein